MTSIAHSSMSTRVAARAARPWRGPPGPRADLLAETFLSTRARRLARAALLAAGALAPALPAGAANFNVANEAQLRSAITSAQNGDTITFTANITLGADLPQVQRSVTINGGNHTLSGANTHRGLFVQSGTVAVNDLTIANAKAPGGNGGDGGEGGGGGAGLGGALFVANGANVTVGNVIFQGNLTQGGNGGSFSAGLGNGGGGGGMFGNGGNADRGSGGTGGLGGGGNGGNRGVSGQPGNFGGGGGGGGFENLPGGNGGFGGGGGGGRGGTSGGGAGGFGGGRGGQAEPLRNSHGGGGGGAALGGAVFVQEGGKLTMDGRLDIVRNTVAGGKGGIGGGVIGRNGQDGQGIGSGIFLHGAGSFTVAPGAGQTQAIGDAIADQTGIAGSGGSWSLVKNGAGTTILTGANAYSGGTTVNAGVLRGNASGLQGNITNNASVVFAQEGSGTYAGNLSGPGTLTKTGSGDLTLRGTNTHTGGTTVTGGALLFTSDANLGAAGRSISLSNGMIGKARRLGAQTINRPVTITNSGGFRVDDTSTLTWSGVISGGGQLVKTGDSDLILSGANTYSGGTAVTGGVLRFTNDTNLGAAGTGITLNGGSVGTTTDTQAATSIGRTITLAGDGGIAVALHPLTWSGNISGSGRLIKLDNGELELTGTNTYSGGTRVERGTLRVASDAKLGAAGGQIELANNGGLRASETFASARSVALSGAGGVFNIDPGKTLTLSGIVSGSNLIKVGPGTLELTGANTYTGNIFNNGGRVQGNATSLRGNIAFDPNAQNPIARAVTFDQASTGTFAGNITGRGSFAKTGAGTLTLSGANSYTGGTTVFAGTLQGTSTSLQGPILNNATVVFDQGFDGTYAGGMTGSGALIKNGAGNLDLTGNSSVGGGTTINDGGFAVNGLLTSNVTLNQGGTLSGVGRITGNITNNGGTIEPGNSIGNITINGSLTWSGGTYEVDVDPNDSDRIALVGPNGRATIRGGTVEIAPSPGTYVPNTTYTILATSQGVTGNFDGVTGGVGLMKPRLASDATNLYLILALPPDAFRSAGQTVNQQAVGGALDAIAAGSNVGDLITALANMPTAPGPQALQALSGEPWADFGTVNLRASQLFAHAVGRQMAVARGAGLGAPRSVALAEACEVACDTEAPRRFSAWLNGIGSTGSVLGDDNASGLTYTLGGTAFGLDYRLDPRFLLGIAGGYVGGTQWVNGFSGNGYTDALSVALYGSFTQNPGGGGFYADALAGYANASNRMQRVVAVPGLPTGLASGTTSANQFLGQLETGYKLDLGFPSKASITPFGRLQVGSVNQQGFTESGQSLFNLAVAPQTTTSVRTTFGVDLAAGFDLGGGTLLDLGLRLGWMHEFADTARPISAAFAAAPGAQFTVFGATPQRDSAVIGFSAASTIGDRTSLFIGYEGEVGGGTDNHQLKAGLRLTF